MQYCALLRGINVGGKNSVNMADLKKSFEGLGFTGVGTYINSGNVIFQTAETDRGKITGSIEEALHDTFSIPIRVVIRNRQQIEQTVKNAPITWKKKNDLRCYIAFVREPVTVEAVKAEIKVKDGVDFLHTGEGVLYMSTKLAGLTKSGFTKLATKKIYRDITIRNFNTVQKIIVLMKGME